jgi:hypothetical protein
MELPLLSSREFCADLLRACGTSKLPGLIPATSR